VTKPIEFYFDFASPYGFLAAMQIDVLPPPVTWKPFRLGAVYKTFGQSPLEHPLKREYVIKVDAPRMARRIGMSLTVPSGFPEHALPPSRVFYWIDQQDPAKAVAFAKVAYRKPTLRRSTSWSGSMITCMNRHGTD
jgi:2-hydroxychromene-2-carboxylate isomerase